MNHFFKWFRMFTTVTVVMTAGCVMDSTGGTSITSASDLNAMHAVDELTLTPSREGVILRLDIPIEPPGKELVSLVGSAPISFGRGSTTPYTLYVFELQPIMIELRDIHETAAYGPEPDCILHDVYNAAGTGNFLKILIGRGGSTEVVQFKDCALDLLEACVGDDDAVTVHLSYHEEEEHWDLHVHANGECNEGGGGGIS